MQIESEIDFISGESLALAGEGPRGINSRSGTPLLDLHPAPPLFTHCQLLYTVAEFVYFFIFWYLWPSPSKLEKLVEQRDFTANQQRTVDWEPGY